MSASEKLREVIEDHQADLLDGLEEGAPDAAIVTKMVVLVEWRGSGNTKQLSLVSADAAGDQLVTWEIRGLLHEALYFWPDGDRE